MAFGLRPLLLSESSDVCDMFWDILTEEDSPMRGLRAPYALKVLGWPEESAYESTWADAQDSVSQLDFVAYSDGVPVGYATLRTELTEALREYGGHIGYAIRPSERGKGYGALLLEAVLAEAKMAGLDDVLLIVRCGHVASVHTALSIGGMLEWEKEGRRCFKIKTDRAERVTKGDVRDILKNWSQADDQVERVAASTWRVGRNMLKVYRDEAVLKKSLAIASSLRARHIPAPQELITTDGAPYAAFRDGFFVLIKRLPGKHPDPMAENCGQRVGAALARLHGALADIDVCCREGSLCGELDGWVRDALRGMHTPLHAVCAAISPFEESLMRQLIHRDPHPGNLLFEGDQLTGFIDFDLCERNIRVFDLCYFATGALVGRQDQAQAWLNLVGEVFDAYDAMSLLSDAERASAPFVMAGIELLFAAFFKKDGYDALAKEAVELANWIMEHKYEIHASVLKKGGTVSR